MAWTFNISALPVDRSQTEAFGQVQFSGNYTTGGDAAGTFVTAAGTNTAGWPDYKRGASQLHASRPPVRGNFQVDGGYIGVIVPVANSAVPKLKLINPATGAELAAGAYPAAITSAVYHTLELDYRVNL
ncbi:MAG TPA: hypothetical protein VN709_04070 [Terriglobales bacterium]|nr:hypothetical protein [Terriglobales bacterium]